MKRLVWASLGWVAAILAVPIAWALYVIMVPNPNYDPVLDNDGDLQGAGIFLLSSPFIFLGFASLLFTVGLIGRSIRNRRSQQVRICDALATDQEPTMRAYSFEVTSVLPMPPSAFWANATLAAVNAELAPWVRMTAPAAWRTRPLREWPAGTHLFKSWILLFGFLPIDLHSFFLESITPCFGFEERSTSAMNRHWDHSRQVLAHADGCQVTDRVRYESRLPLVGAALLPIYRAIFVSRHRYLRRRYHGSAASA